jgi:hypothetical protein
MVDRDTGDDRIERLYVRKRVVEIMLHHFHGFIIGEAPTSFFQHGRG